MTSRLGWQRDGRDWPNRAASRFVRADNMTWHVQVMGAGPVLLLAHGTGAATHSWRDLAPLLAAHFTVVAPDLPGHGFTDTPPGNGLSLPGMARGLGALVAALGVNPVLAAGHSAGAAVLARMILDNAIAPRALVSLNGALLPRLFAWRAGDPATVQRLLRGTGSCIDARGAEFYRRLAANPVHAGAALGMMANWDLQPLVRDLPKLPCTLVLVAGSNDRTIAPADAVRVRTMVPGATVVTLPGLGHLAHEEQPRQTADLICQVARDAGVLPP